MSLPPEILKKVKLLELSTRKLVNNIFAGEYHTAFKGQGMTFAEFREYVPGDDVRHIAWPLTARTGKPFIKKFDEERELTLILAVDISGSADFGSGKYFKGEIMAYLAALLSFSAEKNGDQIGLLLFSDQVEHYVPPKKGRGHVQRILRDLFYFKPKSRGTKLDSALRYLQGLLRKKATIFIISDFMDTGFDSSLRLLGKKHDVTALVIEDHFERTLPAIGLVELLDAESGDLITVDSSSEIFRKSWEVARRREQELRDKLLRQSQVERVDIPNHDKFYEPLVSYFRRRKAR